MKLFLKICKCLAAIYFGYLLAMILILFGTGFVASIFFVFEGKLDEAVVSLGGGALVVAFVGFVVWASQDAKQFQWKLEQHRRARAAAAERAAAKADRSTPDNRPTITDIWDASHNCIKPPPGA